MATLIFCTIQTQLSVMQQYSSSDMYWVVGMKTSIPPDNENYIVEHCDDIAFNGIIQGDILSEEGVLIDRICERINYKYDFNKYLQELDEIDKILMENKK